MSKLVSTVVIALCFYVSFAVAETAKLDVEGIKKSFAEKIGIEIESVTPTAMVGVVEIVTPQGIFYTDITGSFLIQGKLFGINGGVTNYTEETLMKLRIAGMKKFENDMIVYKAENEKHVITVFTDITCGYCRKMHEQMADYNKQGITVRYLAYPRNGISDYAGNYSKDFENLRSVWCNENPAAALTKAKAGGNIPHRICEKPIEAEFAFGRQIGVNGTPAIMLSNGMMVPGYKAPQDLIRIFAELESSLGN